jgi:hypothetical protein
VDHRVDLPRLRQRVGEDDAGRIGREHRAGAGDRGRLGRGLDPPGDGVARVGEVEPREAVGPVTEHRHGQRLQPLQRRRHVEDRLDAAHTTTTGVVARTPRSAEMSKVSAAPRCTAAESTGREDPDPRPMASAAVEATVVAPVSPSATATPRSRFAQLGDVVGPAQPVELLLA